MFVDVGGRRWMSVEVPRPSNHCSTSLLQFARDVTRFGDEKVNHPVTSLDLAPDTDCRGMTDGRA